MVEGFISRAFRGRRRYPEFEGRLPPGQYPEDGFPVLSAGPTPRTRLEQWDLRLTGEVESPRRWTWAESRRCRGRRSRSTSTA